MATEFRAALVASEAIHARTQAEQASLAAQATVARAKAQAEATRLPTYPSGDSAPFLNGVK